MKTVVICAACGEFGEFEMIEGQKLVTQQCGCYGLAHSRAIAPIDPIDWSITTRFVVPSRKVSK